MKKGHKVNPNVKQGFLVDSINNDKEPYTTPKKKTQKC